MAVKQHNIVTFKVCPKCHGLGRIPCDGKEYYRQLHKAWAEQFHLKTVVYNWHGYDGEATLLGIAKAQLLPGGWYGLEVYVAVTAIPRSGYYEAGMDGYQTHKLDGRGVPQTVMSVQGIGLWHFHIINNKAFWHLTCRYDDRDELALLDYWPDMLNLEDRNLIEEFSKKELLG